MGEQGGSDSLKEIALDAIERPSAELRRTGSESGMEALRTSIRDHGVLVPIIVQGGGDKYSLVAGKRRVMCAQSLGMATIPAIVVEQTADWQAWAMSAENRLREDVNPVDEANWMAAQMERLECSAQALADILDVSPSYVSQRLASRNWPDEVREPLSQGLISFSHVLAFLPLRETACVLKRRTGFREIPGC